MVYPALLPLMSTPRLPVVADLNGLVLFLPKDEIWSLRVCHHISTGLYGPTFIVTVFVGVFYGQKGLLVRAHTLLSVFIHPPAINYKLIRSVRYVVYI
jgi:hypothetical protein